MLAEYIPSNQIVNETTTTTTTTTTTATTNYCAAV
jgi:hypothetical protein